MEHVFAALLTLLSAQAAVPSVRFVAAIEIVCCTEAEQRAPGEAGSTRSDVQVCEPAPAYVSPATPEPDTAVLFQRPPPAPSLFS